MAQLLFCVFTKAGSKYYLNPHGITNRSNVFSDCLPTICKANLFNENVSFLNLASEALKCILQSSQMVAFSLNLLNQLSALLPDCVIFSAVIVSAVPPVLSVSQQSFNATADYQESVTFTCITSGSPDPVVTWHRYLQLN